MNKSIELHKVFCPIVPLRLETLQEGAPVKDLKPITEVSKLRQYPTTAYNHFDLTKTKAQSF